MKHITIIITFLVLFFTGNEAFADIDRTSLVRRNNPIVTSMDTLSSLTIGNGHFAYTVDATGMQSFPEYYRNGICLGTMSEWGWHSFPNYDDLKAEEALKSYDFGHHTSQEWYACQTKTPGRAHDASEYFRINPHRLHLGVVGFDFPKSITAQDISNISQTLDMWTGRISSQFKAGDYSYFVESACDADEDVLAFSIASAARTPICLCLPYPTGGHTDDGCNWQADSLHQSEIVAITNQSATIKHTLDSTTYYIMVNWNGKATLSESALHKFVIKPEDDRIKLTVRFLSADEKFNKDRQLPLNETCTVAGIFENSARGWQKFWLEGGAVDFSHCTDPRAKELERRVVLSQYQIAVQERSSYPPQETGLVMNSWFGRFHLEMVPWHMAWMPLWGHSDALANTLKGFYGDAQNADIARNIAERQGFEGIRWMKMTDPWGGEAPSNVGSFLIWQQPHPIYLWELVYRTLALKHGAENAEAKAVIEENKAVVEATARFMASFASYDKSRKQYILKHYIPAQESLKATETFNSPFELSQWLTVLKMAQEWRERSGEKREKEWDDIIEKLAPLAYNSDGLYLAAESATDTYTNEKATSDHPALLGALGFFPESRLIKNDVMARTLDWVMQNWHWQTSWGWDFPMTAMTATRLHQPEKALEALLMPMQKNTYLNNGHNYQDQRLRLYLPGNGGLLAAVALMCAGWEGCDEANPGFPKDGKWDVRWEGILPLP